jgi:integrase/recombinase XerD
VRQGTSTTDETAGRLHRCRVVALTVADIDRKRMLIWVEHGNGRKDRYAMLSPRLLEVLRVW